MPTVTASTSAALIGAPTTSPRLLKRAATMRTGMASRLGARLRGPPLSAAPKASTSCSTRMVETKTHSSGRRRRSRRTPPMATAITATAAATSIGQPPAAPTTTAVADNAARVTTRAVRRRSCMSRKRSR